MEHLTGSTDGCGVHRGTGGNQLWLRRVPWDVVCTEGQAGGNRFWPRMIPLCLNSAGLQWPSGSGSEIYQVGGGHCGSDGKQEGP